MTYDSLGLRLKQQPPFAPAVIVGVKLTCHPPIQILCVRLLPLVPHNVRRIWCNTFGAALLDEALHMRGSGCMAITMIARSVVYA